MFSVFFFKKNKWRISTLFRASVLTKTAEQLGQRLQNFTLKMASVA